MLTKDNEYMDEAAQTLYNYNSDALIRERCRDRETQLFFERTDQAKIKELSEENAKLTDENAALSDEVAKLKAEIAHLLKQATSTN